MMKNCAIVHNYQPPGEGCGTIYSLCYLEIFNTYIYGNTADYFFYYENGAKIVLHDCITQYNSVLESSLVHLITGSNCVIDLPSITDKTKNNIYKSVLRMKLFR